MPYFDRMAVLQPSIWDKPLHSHAGSGSGSGTVQHPRWVKNERVLCVCADISSYLYNSFIWALNATGSVICIVDSERAFQSFTACGEDEYDIDVLWWLRWNKWFAVEIPGEACNRVQQVLDWDG